MKEWERFLSGLEAELTSNIVETWLRRPLRVTRFDAANLYLEASDPMAIAWFEEHIRPRLKHNFFNENNRPIRIHLQLKKAVEAPPDGKAFEPQTLIRSDSLDPHCTLERFFTFEQNRIAHRLALEVISQSTPGFNPIFLYGPKASGKTHLLMAIGNALKNMKRIFYVRADTFTEHVVQAIRAAHMKEFRSIYRDIDLLLVDDVDRFASRAATQEEFFHTFNALHTAGKQIILTSQLPPSKIQDIEPRLISRFEWGLALHVEPASTESILTLKAQAWNVQLSEDLMAFLLEKFPSDPLLALQAIAVRSKGPLTPAAAGALLSDLLKAEAQKAITPEKIIKAISAHYGLTVEDLLGKSQTREIATPRQIAMYVCREKLKLPYQAIGKLFGRDHSTVLSSVKMIQKGIEEKNQEWIEAAEAASKLKS